MAAAQEQPCWLQLEKLHMHNGVCTYPMHPGGTDLVSIASLGYEEVHMRFAFQICRVEVTQTCLIAPLKNLQ